MSGRDGDLQLRIAYHRGRQCHAVPQNYGRRHKAAARHRDKKTRLDLNKRSRGGRERGENRFRTRASAKRVQRSTASQQEHSERYQRSRLHNPVERHGLSLRSQARDYTNNRSAGSTQSFLCHAGKGWKSRRNYARWAEANAGSGRLSRTLAAITKIRSLLELGSAGVKK